jgi:hypothetical protein
MGVIDMFAHPVMQASESNLFDLAGLDWPAWCDSSKVAMDAHGVEASGVCVMDESILDRPEHLEHLDKAMATGRFWFTFMPDIRRDDVHSRVTAAADAGFRGLTFHSYLQKVTQDDYASVAALAKQAESLGLFTGLCTAYGSKHMFDYQSLPLATEVARVASGPILLYHAGGAKVLEAMLLCEMWPNLYLETSFSLSYWLGSSVETDLAFAIRKLGARRVMFGSDSPFESLSAALHDHSTFFEKHGIAVADRTLILGANAKTLLGMDSCMEGPQSARVACSRQGNRWTNESFDSRER